jgi:hypothetical protein
MNEVSNEALMGVLIDIKGDIGKLEGKFDGHTAAFAAHCADDKTISENVQKLQLSAARQKGFVAAISTVGAVLGAGLGALADYLSRGSSH